MRINEDFLDKQDIELDDVEVEHEEPIIPFKEWNKKYAHEYDQLIVLSRIYVGTEAVRDIEKTKIWFERLLEMFYPDHAPIQLIYTNESSYDKIYQTAGAQYESNFYSEWLLEYSFKNSVRFKTCIQIGYKPREIKNFLNFAAALNKLSYKKIGSQTAGGRTEIYLSDGGNNFTRPGTILDTVLPIYFIEIHDGKKYNRLSAEDLAETVAKYTSEDETKVFKVIEEWWKSLSAEM